MDDEDFITKMAEVIALTFSHENLVNILTKAIELMLREGGGNASAAAVAHNLIAKSKTLAAKSHVLESANIAFFQPNAPRCTLSKIDTPGGGKIKFDPAYHFRLKEFPKTIFSKTHTNGECIECKGTIYASIRGGEDSPFPAEKWHKCWFCYREMLKKTTKGAY